MHRPAALLLAIFASVGLMSALPAPVSAQSWNFGTVANISDTLGVNDGRVCVGEGSRQDIGCPTYAPSVNSSGLFTATTIATGGLTVTGATSLSTISATIGDFTTLRVNGVDITGGSGGGSSTLAMVTGSYTGNGAASQTITLGFRPKMVVVKGSSSAFTYFPQVVSFDGIPDGEAELYSYYADNYPGNQLDITSTGFTVMGNVNDSGINFNTRVYNYIAFRNVVAGADEALGDRITSSTTAAVIANESGGTVSFTLGGTAGAAYLHPTLGLVAAGVSTTGTISASQIFAGTNLQLLSPTAPTACNGSTAGSLRYNSPTTTLELCTGNGWQPMGVGIPAGTISAFASTTCPVGWSEYTPARGRFLRGIDNGAGNDPSGTRAPGAIQGDLFRSHTHAVRTAQGSAGSSVGNVGSDLGGPWDLPNSALATGGAETRPVNVAVTFCQFNGTSNGWNNPLSGGGGGTPAGSNGQVQFNSGGAFGASAGLTFDNATSRLTATNISATALTVAGAASTGTLATGGLTVTGATSITTISATIGSFTSLTVAGQPILPSGGVAFMAKNMSGNATTAVGSALPMDTVRQSGGIGIVAAGNGFTVSGGSAYVIEADVRCDGTGTAVADYGIYDVTNNGYVGGYGACQTSGGQTTDVKAVAFVSPSVSTTYEIRIPGKVGTLTFLGGVYSTLSAFKLGGGNGSTGGGGTPAGSNGQVQFNSGGAFGASAGLTFDNATSRLTATNISATALTVAGRTSTTVLQLGNDGGACNASTVGTLRLNPVNDKLELCRRLN